MARTKNLPNDVKRIVLEYIRGYKRRRMSYEQKRDDILHRAPARYEEYLLTENRGKKNERKVLAWEYPGHTSGESSSVENKAIALQQLEERRDTRIMRCVEQATNTIGCDLCSDEDREKLIDAMWESCLHGRDCPYEVLDTPGIGRSDFYRRRDEFLKTIARLDGLI